MSKRLPISEVFETLQGEARFTGTPSVFIRTQGCDVGCPWCDTKHTWELDESRAISLDEIVAQKEASDRFALATVDELVKVARGYRARHAVITGGEPCAHNIAPLLDALEWAGFTTQVETSGTEKIRVPGNTWVTVSPKIDMPGAKKVRLDAIDRANELKMPVGKMADVVAFERLLQGIPFDGLIWLQPLSASPKATALCIDEATKRNWRVSIQTHRFIGVR